MAHRMVDCMVLIATQAESLVLKFRYLLGLDLATLFCYSVKCVCDKKNQHPSIRKLLHCKMCL